MVAVACAKVAIPSQIVRWTSKTNRYHVKCMMCTRCVLLASWKIFVLLLFYIAMQCDLCEICLVDSVNEAPTGGIPLVDSVNETSYSSCAPTSGFDDNHCALYNISTSMPPRSFLRIYLLYCAERGSFHANIALQILSYTSLKFLSHTLT